MTLFPVNINNKVGAINNLGELVIKPEFGEILDFREDRAAFAIGDVFSLSKYGIIDATGNIIVEPKYDFICPYSDGICRAMYEDNTLYLDLFGNILHSAPFLESDDYACGLACVKEKSYNLYGYLNRKGSYHIKPQFYKAFSFSEGLARVKIKGNYGYIDLNGKVIIEPKYCYGWNYSEDLAAIATNQTHTKVGFINKTGELVISPKYRGIELSFKEGMAVVSGKNAMLGYINKDGVLVIPYRYSDAKPFSCGLASVCEKGNYGYINKEGDYVIESHFAEAGSFEDGLAFVKTKDKKAAYINASGKRVWVWDLTG
jgi:hypothetical protein